MMRSDVGTRPVFLENLMRSEPRHRRRRKLLDMQTGRCPVCRQYLVVLQGTTAPEFHCACRNGK